MWDYYQKLLLNHLRNSIFRSSPRRWPSRLELRCVRPSVRPYVRTSTKSFSDFHLIWCVDRSRSHMRTSVTSTRSKVKVKVTELPKLRKVLPVRCELDWKPPWTASGPSLGVQIKTFSLRGFATYPLTRGRGFRLQNPDCHYQYCYQIWADNWGLCPFVGGGGGSPSNTMWPGTRPTCMPSFILIHPTVWSQYTNVTDIPHRQTNGLIA